MWVSHIVVDITLKALESEIYLYILYAIKYVFNQTPHSRGRNPQQSNSTVHCFTLKTTNMNTTEKPTHIK